MARELKVGDNIFLFSPTSTPVSAQVTERRGCYATVECKGFFRPWGDVVAGGVVVRYGQEAFVPNDKARELFVSGEFFSQGLIHETIGLQAQGAIMSTTYIPSAGAIIEGTLLPNDVIPAMAGEAARFEQWPTSITKAMYDEWSEDSSVDECDAVHEALEGMLNDVAPEHLYFGTHPDDGACIGWWEHEEIYR